MIHTCRCKVEAVCGDLHIYYCHLHAAAEGMLGALEKIVALGHHLISDDCGGRVCSSYCPACVAQKAITGALVVDRAEK